MTLSIASLGMWNPSSGLGQGATVVHFVSCLFSKAQFLLCHFPFKAGVYILSQQNLDSLNMHFRPLLALEVGSAPLRPHPQMWREIKTVPRVLEQFLLLHLSKILESPDSHNKSIHTDSTKHQYPSQRRCLAFHLQEKITNVDNTSPQL